MIDFASVTELPNFEVTTEQIDRLAHRYIWAGEFCLDKDVLEVACGPGQGLSYLLGLAKSLKAGDITPALVEQARLHYGQRIKIEVMDALHLPYGPDTFDVIILFEAVYYLSSVTAFINECRRVLRSGGQVLIATANKDLYDFNPSPFSHSYYGVQELYDLFNRNGFSCKFFGYMPVNTISWRQRILRPVKKLIIMFNLLPRTMSGKKLLKRIVFGKLVTMPSEINNGTIFYKPPIPIQPDKPDHLYKVIYLSARLIN